MKQSIWPPPLLTIVAAILLIPSFARANHGPGTSGGGSATMSGETLKQGQSDLSLSENYTQFEDIDAQHAERIATKSGGFDALRSAFILSGSGAYGITDDLQVSATLGYYWGNNFIDAESDDGVTAESATADPEGMTDLGLMLKYRVLKGAPGNLSLLGGVIVPTGNNNIRLSNGALLEPSSQPGTGEWAGQAGLAYSRFLTSHLTIDASGLYTVRFEQDDFKVGDRMDLGVAFAYRLTDSVKSFPNWSIFAEANAVWLGKDTDQGVLNPNSGGWTVYLTPGVRCRFTPHMALTVAPSFPILQDLEGEQIDARFKVAATISFSF